jgi:hypothetical protein
VRKPGSSRQVEGHSVRQFPGKLGQGGIFWLSAANRLFVDFRYESQRKVAPQGQLKYPADWWGLIAASLL